MRPPNLSCIHAKSQPFLIVRPTEKLSFCCPVESRKESEYSSLRRTALGARISLFFFVLEPVLRNNIYLVGDTYLELTHTETNSAHLPKTHFALYERPHCIAQRQKRYNSGTFNFIYKTGPYVRVVGRTDGDSCIENM